MAASPDDLVPPWGETDDGQGLVEIKCPYSNWEHRLPREDGTQYVPLGYLIQMTLQMLVIKRSWCDFVTWTPTGMSVFKLKYNHELGELLKKHCVEFIAAAERGDVAPPPLTSSWSKYFIQSQATNAFGPRSSSLSSKMPKPPSAGAASAAVAAATCASIMAIDGDGPAAAALMA